MRVFVALEIPEEVRRAVEELTGKLKPTCRGARWARAAGMHVTLKFIGEVPSEKVEQIRTELAAVCAARDFGSVELKFRNVGFFPSARHPRVFWAGIEASGNLAELAAEVEGRMETLGIPRERRAFHPHLTLARFDSENGLPELREAIEQFGAVELGATRANEFQLYQSRLERGGAVYSKLESYVFSRTAT